MSNRNWFYASEGQQKGPLPEVQLRDLIARGTIRHDTLVWTEGMSGWQKAAEIPGLIPGAAPPPAFPQAGGPPVVASGGYSGGPLSIDFGIWEFTWRSIVFAIASAFVIPLPWMLVWYLKWLIPCVRVPGRPNLSFEGTAMAVVPWFFGAVVLFIAVRLLDIRVLDILIFLAEIALYWLFFKWVIANIASNGQPLGLSFVGTPWALIGWALLATISFITIIGWAWVYAAATRWFCRNIEGTRHEVIFNGSGLEFLWRVIVAAIGAAFIIPIPWVYRWIWRWLASQTVLVERGSQPGV
ncbi:GYF domain-containing protein [Bradyrhizobium jicamae]|uniref:GYF domain-containing protein n=1 Tax=Bradyrhizobium jicamae TaxID=280332 RepID=UPI001BA6A0C7|nr:GYF domain-containing protein [Bradyrhizobium jicamae]MBR0935216.1 DUF4339 domain-containing protein [Bradyrhizobium jicamae]